MDEEKAKLDSQDTTVRLSKKSQKKLTDFQNQKGMDLGFTSTKDFHEYIIDNIQVILNHTDPNLEMVKVSQEEIAEYKRQIAALEIETGNLEKTIVQMCDLAADTISNLKKIPYLPTAQSFFEQSQLIYSQLNGHRN